ncbi:hypothetical protein STEG23_011367 [Scotinomys teguina]
METLWKLLTTMEDPRVMSTWTVSESESPKDVFAHKQPEEILRTRHPHSQRGFKILDTGGIQVYLVYKTLAMTTGTMEDLSMANTMFALNVLKHIEQTNPTQNVFFSPWSISTTLAMILLGARGDTEQQMASVLQFNKVGDYDITMGAPENISSFDITQQIQRKNDHNAILQIQARNKIHSSFNALSSAINTCSGDYLLESANKLFGDKSARFKEEYTQGLKRFYSTEPEAVDFQNCTEEARMEINSWVKDQTKGKIPNLLPEDSVDEGTKMVLVNTVYFKGKWRAPFQKKPGPLHPFRVNSHDSVPVQMMYLRERLNIGYIKDLKVQILELPYIGNISMFLLLPDEIDDASTGLELLESEINFDKFNKWISKDTMAENDVEVYIPKFKLEQHYELKSILSSMGMKDAFNKNKANFSGMSQKNDLFLSEVFHQATVDVNEEGTIAAGGTGAVMTGRTGRVIWKEEPDWRKCFRQIAYRLLKMTLVLYCFFLYYKKSNHMKPTGGKKEKQKMMSNAPHNHNIHSINRSYASLVSINQFALELSKKLAESAEGKNTFFSPWSISTSLAMVYLGTKGTTAAQMSKECNSGKVEEIHSDFQALAAEILKPGNSYLLKTANRIYGEKTYPFHNKYLKDMQTYFGAEPQSVNFVGASDQIRAEINIWVENQTGGKIPNLLPDDSVDSKTKMVLVNALYFKGVWEHQFSAQNTTERPFRINKTMSKPVQMMSMKKNLPVFHIEELQTIGLQLYYKNRDLSLLLLLPEDVNGLEQLERAITYEKLNEWTSEDMMDTFEVHLYLPKFKLEESYDLKSALSSMGMTDAFNQNKADFSNMSSDRNLFLSNVFHKTFVEINEEGTEAAAGTGSESLQRPPPSARPPSASSGSSVPPRASGLDKAADGRRRAAGHSSEFGSSSGGVSMGLASGVRALIMSNFNKEEFECHILDKGFTAKDIVDQKINEVSSSDDKDAFYVADLGDILKKHLRWRKTLPRVTPFYAVKCNNSRAIVNTLAAIGTVWCHTQNYQASPGTGNELNIDVISVSFHVGSGCTDPETFVQALSDACCVFDMGTEVGFSMYLLDIGGGFPGSEDTKLKFEEITSVINPVLDKYFPPDSGVKVIAEPGRYYVASAFTLAVNIIAKKLVWKEQTGSDDEDESNEQTFMYYVNDGVYESFNCILYDHAHVKALLPKRPKPDEKYYSSSIWGPTCDGLDRIVERCNLPEMHVGDWMLFENMGAYTVAAASTFNGFQRPSIYYVMSRSLWQLMKQIQSHGFPPEVEEQDVGALPLSCAQESGMDRHPVSCAAASINV